MKAMIEEMRTSNKTSSMPRTMHPAQNSHNDKMKPIVDKKDDKKMMEMNKMPTMEKVMATKKNNTEMKISKPESNHVTMPGMKKDVKRDSDMMDKEKKSMKNIQSPMKNEKTIMNETMSPKKDMEGSAKDMMMGSEAMKMNDMMPEMS
jgi:hypothetical protein